MKSYTTNMDVYLGKTVQIKIDRPLGSFHPQHPDIQYLVNYGYLPDVPGGDGEPQDVYLLGVTQPVTEYTAKIIAVIHRMDDVEDKLVAAPEGMSFTARQIRAAVQFQEQYFHSSIKLDPKRPVVTFYRNDPNAPKTTMPTHLGANAIITYNGRILLEKRRDSNTWGLIGGGVKKTETAQQAITREIHEELGLRICKHNLRKLDVYGEPGRIAAYKDGSIWRMVVVVFGLELTEAPSLQISDESCDLRFFTKQELQDIHIVVTHSDIVEEWFVKR